MTAKRSDSEKLIDHYDTENGLGNLYKLNSDWLTGIKTIFQGWENVPEHPGGVHYAYDYGGSNANEALKRPFYEAFADLSIDEGKILDCGCGVGGAAFILAPLHPKISFVGVSLSPGQIHTAKLRAQKANIKNVSYFVADYLNLPFEDDVFDGIIGIETFCHVADKDKPKLFKELKRVLKRGKRIAIFDAYVSRKLPEKMAMLAQHQRIFRGWSLPDSISTLKTTSDAASQAGLKMIKNINMTNRILGWSKEVSNRALLAIPLAPLIKAFVVLRQLGIKLPVISQLGFDNPKILEFAYTTRFQYYMFASGDTEYREVVFKK